MTTFHLIITSVEGAKFEGEAESLTVPGSDGELTILAHHEPFVTTLKKGKITVRKGKALGNEEIAITGGVLEVSGNRAVVLL